MELHITSKRPTVASSIKEFLAYRDLLWILAHREISVRYKQAALGVLWVVLQPVIMTVLFTFVGKALNINSDNVPRAIFIFCGMTIMNFFVGAVGRAGLSVIADEKLITKVYFPRTTIPLASVVACGFDYIVSLVLLLIVACFYGYFPSYHIWAVIPATIIVILSASGLGLAFAGWTVRYRDFRYVVPFFLQLIPYASPTFYPMVQFPQNYREWLFLNPMCGAIQMFRNGITGVTPVNHHGAIISMSVAIGLFLFGSAVFQRVEQSFADHI